MSTYATVDDLRAAPWGLTFELALDETLEQALQSGADEIDSHRPGDLDEPTGERALAVLKRHNLTLARLALHPDQALDATHPVVREATATRAWLLRWSQGQVHLPVDAAPAGGGTGAAYTSGGTVWGRGDGGGL